MENIQERYEEIIKLNKLCVTVFGDIGLIPERINRISENEVRVLYNHKGTTSFLFETALDLDVARDYLKTNQETFFIFDVFKSGDIVLGENFNLEMTNLTKFSLTQQGEIGEIKTENPHEVINHLLDKGVDKLSDTELKLLTKLSNEID